MTQDSQIGLMRITNEYFKIWNRRENDTLYLDYDQMIDLEIQIAAMKQTVEMDQEKKENETNAELVKTFPDNESVQA